MKERINTYILVAMVLLLLPHSGFSQNEHKLLLKATPLSLLDPYGSNLQIGIEWIKSDKLSIETDIAVYIPNPYWNDDTPRIKQRIGFKIKPEIRYYLSKGSDSNPGEGFYLANEIYFVKDHFMRGDTFIRNLNVENDNDLYFDYDIVDRLEIGDNIKIGIQKSYFNKLTLDSFFGVGVKYYNADFEYKVPDPICCPVMRFFEAPIGKGIRPSLTMGVKIGIWIR